MSQQIVTLLRERFGDAITENHAHRGDDTVVVERDRLLEVMTFLKEDPATLLDMPSDLCGVDYLGREPRFEVVYHLYSTKLRHRIRVKVRLSEEDPRVASVVSVYPGLNWFERETWDMYGIRFEGHPDLRRMFMYEEFIGHPLRKDYPKEKRQPLIRRGGNSPS
jgi:NADH-quinone oxidoreductase subunit C